MSMQDRIDQRKDLNAKALLVFDAIMRKIAAKESKKIAREDYDSDINAYGKGLKALAIVGGNLVADMEDERRADRAERELDALTAPAKGRTLEAQT